MQNYIPVHKTTFNFGDLSSFPIFFGGECRLYSFPFRPRRGHQRASDKNRVICMTWAFKQAKLLTEFAKQPCQKREKNHMQKVATKNARKEPQAIMHVAQQFFEKTQNSLRRFFLSGIGMGAENFSYLFLHYAGKTPFPPLRNSLFHLPRKRKESIDSPLFLCACVCGI